MSLAEQPIFIDTHAHLDDGRFDTDLAAVVQTAAEVGVTQIINVGYRPARWQSSIKLSEDYPAISFTLGLHPHHADEFSAELIDDLRNQVNHHRPVALGEIGLDYFRDLSDRTRQREAFAAQLQLALEVDLPVVIHLRGDVEADLRTELDQLPDRFRCVLHSFDGSADLAGYARERRFLFGVGGISTKQSNHVLRETLKTLPAELLLLETDSPYLVPAGVKDRRNSPVTIPRIAGSLAELKGITVAEIARITTQNAVRFFGLRSDTVLPKDTVA